MGEPRVQPLHPNTLGNVLRSYLGYLRRTGRASSVRVAECHVQALEDHLHPSLVAYDLTPAMVDTFIASQLDKRLSRETVNGRLRVLRAALRQAVDREMLYKLPVRVKLLRAGRPVAKPLTPEQVDRLVTVCDASDPRISLALLLAARAGLRHSEILHLQVRDVDLVRRTVRVSPKSAARWAPKSYQEREIPIANGLLERLQQRVETILAAGGYDTSWLFPGQPNGGPRASLDFEVRSAFQAANLYEPGAKCLHRLRKTWASLLLLNGCDLRTLQELGGWADLETVEHYVASNDAAKRAAVEGLG